MRLANSVSRSEFPITPPFRSLVSRSFSPREVQKVCCTRPSLPLPSFSRRARFLALITPGIEWGFWPGPKECTGPLDHARSTSDFLKQLQNVKVARCDAPALRILGLSLAAWNAVISAGLAALGVFGARSRG